MRSPATRSQTVTAWISTTVQAMAQTAKDMNSKYKETSEAGLAISVTLC